VETSHSSQFSSPYRRFRFVRTLPSKRPFSFSSSFRPYFAFEKARFCFVRIFAFEKAVLVLTITYTTITYTTITYTTITYTTITYTTITAVSNRWQSIQDVRFH
jgi:hypothetical protein